MIVIIVGFSRQARQRKRESETERINKEEEETDDFGRKQWTGLTYGSFGLWVNYTLVPLVYQIILIKDYSVQK